MNTIDEHTWIDIDDDVPGYYEVVSVELNTGETYEAWKASSGDEEIWTIKGGSITIPSDDIVKWREIYN